MNKAMVAATRPRASPWGSARPGSETGGSVPEPADGFGEDGEEHERPHDPAGDLDQGEEEGAVVGPEQGGPDAGRCELDVW